MYPNDPTNKVDLNFQAQRPPIHLNEHISRTGCATSRSRNCNRSRARNATTLVTFVSQSQKARGFLPERESLGKRTYSAAAACNQANWTLAASDGEQGKGLVNQVFFGVKVEGCWISNDYLNQSQDCTSSTTSILRSWAAAMLIFKPPWPNAKK